MHMAQLDLEDSADPWKYVILFSKFLLLFVDGGITKSFGVLIPNMVTTYQSDYKTIGLVCSLPTTLMYFTAPVAGLLMRVVNPRVLAMTGGVLSAVPIICAPLAESVYVLGFMLAVTGFGMSLTYFPIMVSINNYFARSFIFSNTLTIFGTTCGAFLVPVIVERSLEAYGYSGAFLILGGISLHILVCGAIVRPPRDQKTTTASPTDRHIQITSSQETGESCETSKFLTGANDEEALGNEGHDSNSQLEDASTPGSCSSCEWLSSRLKTHIFLKEPLYTLVVPSIMLECYVNAAWMLFLVPHAEGAGIPLSRAVFMSSIAGISGIVGRVVYLVLLHFKVDSVLIFGACSVVCAISFFIDSLGSTYIFLAVMSAIQGFTIFILDCLPHAMMKLSVRTEKNLPDAIATNPFLFGMGVLAGDFISGHLYDVTMSFTVLYTTYGVLLAIITVNLLIFRIVVQRSPRGAMRNASE
ncbi:monocarboxylate transporter 12-like [Lytechinus variegatus]|uniref:monocarboxylate transporter 12-like n=1 Tax=Lytechinus variegatus TaxID=7654 RepID=UPI001BB22321|nr:monocarboxylate transporter 12-like [Lytechinus variegatus]